MGLSNVPFRLCIIYLCIYHVTVAVTQTTHRAERVSLNHFYIWLQCKTPMKHCYGISTISLACEGPHNSDVGRALHAKMFYTLVSLLGTPAINPPNVPVCVHGLFIPLCDRYEGCCCTSLTRSHSDVYHQKCY